MTLPPENISHYYRTRQFLQDLSNPQDTPRIPKSIREEASGCLQHFECQNTSERNTNERVVVSLDLNDEEFLLMAHAAHREGVSLNDWVNMALGEVLEEDLGINDV